MFKTKKKVLHLYQIFSIMILICTVIKLFDMYIVLFVFYTEDFHLRYVSLYTFNFHTLYVNTPSNITTGDNACSYRV